MIARLAYRLALENQRLRRRLAERDAQVDRLAERVQRMTWDIDLVTACLPPEKRREALALLRDRHRLEQITEFEEAEWR